MSDSIFNDLLFDDDGHSIEDELKISDKILRSGFADECRLLTEDDLLLLNEVDEFCYPMLGYPKMAALHDKVDVIVCPEVKSHENSAVMTLGDVKKIIKTLTAMSTDNHDFEDLDETFSQRKEYLCKLRKLYEDSIEGMCDSELEKEITVKFPSVKLLGEYVRMESDSRPKVILYKNAIGNNPWLLAQTYVHELHHFLYDTELSEPNSEHYIPCLEEPLAEFGMLRFMQAFEDKGNEKGILDDALQSVRKKQVDLSICFYGFGAFLFEHQQDVPWVEMLIRKGKTKGDALVQLYKDNWKNHVYPFGKELFVSHDLFKALAPNSDIYTLRNTYNFMVPAGLTWYCYDDNNLKGNIYWAHDANCENVYITTTVHTYANPSADSKYPPAIYPNSIVHIDSNVTEFLPSTFGNKMHLPGMDWCTAKDILVDVNNPKYLFHDGILYDKDTRTALIGLTTRKRLEILPGTVKIGDEAFCCHCRGLVHFNNGTSLNPNIVQEIIIPDTVREIGEASFLGYKGKTLVVPNSVTAIGLCAFGGVPCVNIDEKDDHDAMCLNGYEEGIFVFEDNSKTNLKACLGCAEGRIEIPHSVKNICGNAFHDIHGIKEIVIPKEVETIDNKFSVDYNVEAIIVDRNNSYFEHREKCNDYGGKWYELCSKKDGQKIGATYPKRLH